MNSKFARYDLAFLDVAASDILSSVLTSCGVYKQVNIDSIRGDETFQGAHPVYILFKPLTKRLLEVIVSVFKKLTLSDPVYLFTTVAACCNCVHFRTPFADLNYPTDPVSYQSDKCGLVNFYIERLPCCVKSLTDELFILPVSHDLNVSTANESYQSLENINLLLWRIKAVDEVYSIGQSAGQLASTFAQLASTAKRRETLYSVGQSSSCTVLFVDPLTVTDPVACLEPYVKPNHFLDLVFAELSPDGHSVRVPWDAASKCAASDQEPFLTDLMRSATADSCTWIRRDLMRTEQESLVALQRMALELAEAVQHNLPEFSRSPSNRFQWAELLLSEATSLFAPICASGKLELLDDLQCLMAAGLALSTAAKRLRGELYNCDGNSSSSKQLIGLEKLRERFERSLLAASQLDSQLLAQMEEPTNCDPILLRAIGEASKLPCLDDMFFFVAYLINLIPVHSPVSESVRLAVQNLFRKGEEMRVTNNKHHVCLIPTCIKGDLLWTNIERFRKCRRNLPSYNNLIGAHPRYKSPLVQLLKDILDARENPDQSSPALKGLVHHQSPSSSAKWLTGLSRYFRMGSTIGSQLAPYTTDRIFLVIPGNVTVALVRELLNTIRTSNSTIGTPLKLSILANCLTGGPAGVSGFFNE